ncbi:MAG: hypothetical protein AAB436_01120 [Patescibacteria group bacterium]
MTEEFFEGSESDSRTDDRLMAAEEIGPSAVEASVESTEIADPQTQATPIQKPTAQSPLRPAIFNGRPALVHPRFMP